MFFVVIGFAVPIIKDAVLTAEVLARFTNDIPEAAFRFAGAINDPELRSSVVSFLA